MEFGSIALPQTSALIRAAIGPPTDSGIVSATSVIPFLAISVSRDSGTLSLCSQPVLGGEIPAQGTRSVESIEKITRSSLKNFAKEHHFRKDIVIATAGPMSAEEILATLVPLLPKKFRKPPLRLGYDPSPSRDTPAACMNSTPRSKSFR